MGYVRGDLQGKCKDLDFMAAYTMGSLSRSERVAGAQVYAMWQLLEPMIKAIRELRGPTAFDNFEYAAVRAKLWFEKHPDGTYPPGTPRMEQLAAAGKTQATQ